METNETPLLLQDNVDEPSVDTDLTDDEKQIISRARVDCANGGYIPLDDL